MAKTVMLAAIMGLFLFQAGIYAQENTAAPSTAPVPAPTDITGTWVTQTGNLVEVTLNGTEVALYFPDYARRLTATFDGSVLVYITHYRDPMAEDCYINVPDDVFEYCRKLIQVGEARHRFTLTLSPDGRLLSGTKEISVLQVKWDTDENGNPTNYQPDGYVWEYFSDYQWRRSECDFSSLPALNGNILQKYDLIDTFLDQYGLAGEFSLGDFNSRDTVKFVYEQAFIDADTGVFVAPDQVAAHAHMEPLDGRVYRNPDSGQFEIELYPYAFQSYVNLLSGLTIMLHQYKAVTAEGIDLSLVEPTLEMQIESVDYAWTHRNSICAGDDELFGHHIDFLSRAFRLLAMSGG